MNSHKSTRSDSSVLSPLLALFLIVALIGSALDNFRADNEIESLEEQIEALELECDAAYDRGYESARDKYETDFVPTSSYDIYYEINSMDSDEILKYLNDVTGETYWTISEVQDAMVYAFQRGYANHKNGIWDDMTEEYIDGYLFSEKTIETYSFFEWD